MGDVERAETEPLYSDPLNSDRSSSSSSSSDPDSARHHHHHHHHHKKLHHGVSFVGIIGVATAVCLVFFGSYMYISTSEDANSPTAKKYSEEKIMEKEIMLFGDSLVGVPDTEYHMGEGLEKDIEKVHPEYDTVISISFGNGNTASDLYSRVDEDVLNRKSTPNPPQAVIILFDSDAADVDEGENADDIRSRYAEKLDALLGKVRARVDYVALSGPILDGEKKEGENEKDDKLDAYENINKKLAKKHDIAYIDLRAEFLSNDKGFDQEQGHLTQDGEHPKRKGEEIIEDAFRKQILSWNGLWTGPTTRLINFKAPASLKTLIKSLETQHSHEECVRQADEKKCDELEKAMKEAKEMHLDTIKLENGEEIALEDEMSVATDKNAEEEVEEAIEIDRETHGTFKNVNFDRVKEKVKEDEEMADKQLAKESKQKNSKKSKAKK